VLEIELFLSREIFLFVFVVVAGGFSVFRFTVDVIRNSLLPSYTRLFADCIRLERWPPTFCIATTTTPLPGPRTTAPIATVLGGNTCIIVACRAPSDAH